MRIGGVLFRQSQVFAYNKMRERENFHADIVEEHSQGYVMHKPWQARKPLESGRKFFRRRLQSSSAASRSRISFPDLKKTKGKRLENSKKKIAMKLREKK